MICPGFSRLNFNTIPDGLSNTMMVSEQSDYLYYSNGQMGGDFDMTSTANGLYRGHSAAGLDNLGNILPGQPWMDSRGQTFTTIRYSINQKTGWQKGVDYIGVSPSQWQSEGANVPLVSSHTGGVNALFGDGSVHFLQNAVDLVTLARLATRDDGGVLLNQDW
jgi:prepilin-type processing-associated H-X9-DG protein